MENDLEESVRKLGKKLEEARKVEEEVFKKAYENVKPLFLQCLKSIQSSLGEGQTLMLDNCILENSDEAARYGITFCTQSHVIVQQIDVIQGKVLPVGIEIFSAEEFMSKINSIAALQLLTHRILGFLKAVKSENSKANYSI